MNSEIDIDTASDGSMTVKIVVCPDDSYATVRNPAEVLGRKLDLVKAAGVSARRDWYA